MKDSPIKSTVIIFLAVLSFTSCNLTDKKIPERVIAELNTGETQEVILTNGDKVKLTLLELKEIHDSLRNAIRGAEVKISVDGTEIILNTGNYNLPVSVGEVQIDCPSLKGHNRAPRNEPLKSFKDARFRLWPKNSPLIDPKTFVYPIKQAWFANMTQAANEPTYVDGGENPMNKRIYYHSNLDIGGAEGMDEIVSATDGLVISARKVILDGYDSIPVFIYPDAVSVIDKRGWLIEYVHLDSIDPAISPGARVKMGQKIGYIGKQGTSGGWVHLHFAITTNQTPSGEWVTEDSYAYAWEAYIRQYNPPLLAVARPHQLIWAGQEATLDGRKSRSFAGEIVSYEWTFSDGSSASGAVVKRNYDQPGEYSEILKLTDSKGNVDYDFTVVQVCNRENPEKEFPAIQPAFHPTLNIKPGNPVTFLVRTFNSEIDNEVWDFGDGSPKVNVRSDPVPKDPTMGKFAETTHSFSKPGDYIVRVERSNENGYKAIAHLHVVVNK